MRNGIYALANPYGEGGTISLNEDFNVKTEETAKMTASCIEAFEKFCDEPVIGKNTYDDHKVGIAVGWGIAATLIVGALAVAACVVTGGIAAGAVVLATAAVVGSISAGMNYLGQKATIELTGEGEIDWCSVAISGFGGAISGAVAASPLGILGQMFVNGGISGLQTLTMGGSWADITLNTGIGIISGWLGGSGPSWKDTNVFMPNRVPLNSGAYIATSTTTRFWSSFKAVWLGLDAEKYITPQFSGVLSGILKGTAFSNSITNLPGIVNQLWQKYKPESEEDLGEEDEEQIEASLD